MKGRIIPPITTPFVDDRVSTEKLRFNLERYNSTKIGGVLVLGSNGESVFLNDEEKYLMIETGCGTGIRLRTHRTPSLFQGIHDNGCTV